MTGGTGPVVGPGLYAGTGGFAATGGLATNWVPPVPALRVQGSQRVTQPSLQVSVQLNGSIRPGGLLRTVVLTGQAASPVGTATQLATAYQVAVTPAATGSRIYGSIIDNTSFTFNGSTTGIDNVNDAANSAQYGTFRSSSLTTSGTPVTVGASSPSRVDGAVVAVEFEAGTGLAEDSSAPPVVTITSGTLLQTAGFSPPAGSIVVLLVSGLSSAATVSDTLGLTWNTAQIYTADGLAAVYWALVPTGALTTHTAPYLIGGSAASVSVLEVPVTTPMGPGESIVVSAMSMSGAVSGVADSRGNQYTFVQTNTASANSYQYICAQPAALLGPGDSVWITRAGSTNFLNGHVVGVPGLVASPVDSARTTASGTSTAPSATTGTLSQAFEYVLAFEVDASAGGAPSWAGGWTALDTQHGSGGTFSSVAFQAVTSTAAVTASATTASAAWEMLVLPLEQNVPVATMSGVGTLGGTPTLTTGVNCLPFGTGTVPGATTVSVPAPAGVALGDLLMIWAVDVSTTITFTLTGSTGWTSLGPTTGQNCQAYLFYKNADATDVSLSSSAGSYTLTPSAAHSTEGVIIQAPGYSLDVTPANAGAFVSLTNTSLPVTSITTISSGDTILLLACNRIASGAPPVMTLPVSFSTLMPQANSAAAAAANAGVMVGTQVQASAGATGTQTITSAAAADGGGLLLGLVPPSSGFTSGSSMSGSGTLGAGPYFDATPAVMSGSGTLGAAPVLTAAGAMSGVGSLSAAPFLAGASAMSGLGTLSASGAQLSATAALSGVGSLAASPQLSAAAALSGLGTLSAAPYLAGAGALSGLGTLSGPWTVSRLAAMSGTGTLAASPYFAAAAAMSGLGTLSAAPYRAGAAALSGLGTLSAAPVLPGAAVLSGLGVLGSTPAFSGSAALSGLGTLSGPWTFGDLSVMSGLGTLNGVPGGGTSGSASLTGLGTLSAAGYLASPAALAGLGTLTGGGQLMGAAALSGLGTLAGLPSIRPVAALFGIGTLAAAPFLTAAATLAGLGTLTGAGSLRPLASLSGLGTLSAAAVTGYQGAAVLSGQGTLTASWLVAGASSATLSGTGTLSGHYTQSAPGYTGTATWHAGPAAARWRAGPAEPRWLAGPGGARWLASPAPPRWTAGNVARGGTSWPDSSPYVLDQGYVMINDEAGRLVL
jgi:hypothetical protein